MERQSTTRQVKQTVTQAVHALLHPYYSKREITKDQYRDVARGVVKTLESRMTVRTTGEVFCSFCSTSPKACVCVGATVSKWIEALHESNSADEPSGSRSKGSRDSKDHESAKAQKRKRADEGTSVDGASACRLRELVGTNEPPDDDRWLPDEDTPGMPQSPAGPSPRGEDSPSGEGLQSHWAMEIARSAEEEVTMTLNPNPNPNVDPNPRMQ